MIVKYGSHDIEFTHIIKPKLKRMSISIDGKNNVIVKTPDVPEQKVLELVLNKADWILKKKAEPRERLSGIELKTGALLPYLGKKYYLKLKEDKGAAIGKAYLSFDDSEFTLRYNPYLIKEEYMYQALDNFYREKAKELIVKLADQWAERMCLSYSRITLKKVTKRWGSCSSNKNLMFNYEAVKLPIECLEYIVVHELAHLTHHNHSKAFWKLVQKYLPDYKIPHEQMRNYRL